jgi:hypothetical protein
LFNVYDQLRASTTTHCPGTRFGVVTAMNSIRSASPSFSSVSRDTSDIVAAIDSLRIERPGRHWTANVQGIHTSGCDYWIQVSSDPPVAAGLVLHVRPGASIDGVIAALSEWDPAQAPPQTFLAAEVHSPVLR